VLLAASLVKGVFASSAHGRGSITGASGGRCTDTLNKE
jgi:hypothetical protein